MYDCILSILHLKNKLNWIGSRSASTLLIRPTVGRLGHVLADRQSVVQADGQPGPAQQQVAAKYQYLCTDYMHHKRI